MEKKLDERLIKRLTAMYYAGVTAEAASDQNGLTITQVYDFYQRLYARDQK